MILKILYLFLCCRIRKLQMPEFSRFSCMYYTFSVQQYLGEISKNFRKMWKLL